MTVGVRIKEGDRERVQDYTGVIIAIRNGGLHKSIRVRAVLQVSQAPAFLPPCILAIENASGNKSLNEALKTHFSIVQ